MEAIVRRDPPFTLWLAFQASKIPPTLWTVVIALELLAIWVVNTR